MKFRIILIISLLLLASGCKGKNSYETVTLRINQWEISAEIADTLEKQQLGLMHRKTLPENSGMIFVYSHDSRKSFWMKNTSIPLSIAYIAKDGTIKEIYDMAPLSTRTTDSKFSVRYALEVNKGAFEKNGIKPGDKVEFLP